MNETFVWVLFRTTLSLLTKFKGRFSLKKPLPIRLEVATWRSRNSIPDFGLLNFFRYFIIKSLFRTEKGEIKNVGSRSSQKIRLWAAPHRWHQCAYIFYSIWCPGAENARTSKRRSREQQQAEAEQQGGQLFSLGSSQSGGRVRKRLPMTQEAKRNVQFTKLSALSPKKVPVELCTSTILNT